MASPTPFTHGLVVGLQAALPERPDAEALRLCAMQLRSIAAQLIDDADRWEHEANGEGRPIEKAYPVGEHLQVSVNFARVFQANHRLSAAKPKRAAKPKPKAKAKPARRKPQSKAKSRTSKSKVAKRLRDKAG